MQPSYQAFMTARDELCARIVAERAQRFDRKIKGSPFDDDATMINADVGLDDAPPVIFHLIYSDAASALTGRSFKLIRLGQKGNDIAVGGVCFLRHAYRQFVASRIVEVTDLATGEISDDGVRFFGSHPLLAAGDGRYASEEEKAIKARRDELILLTFLAASDGEIHPLEMEAIANFVVNTWDEPLNWDVVAGRIRMFVPDSGAFMRALGRIAGAPGHKRDLTRAIRAVIDADRRIHENEMAFANYIIQRIEEGRVEH